VGKFETVVQCRAPPKAVFDFLASGARTKMKVKSLDEGTMKVTLKSKMGMLSYGEIVDCEIAATDLGSRVRLEGRPVLSTNITADVRGTVEKVAQALVAEFANR